MEHIITLIAMLLGILTHFVWQVIVARREGNKISLLRYWADYPYESIFSLIGSLVLYMISVESGQLNVMNAVMIGMSGNAVIDKITKRAKLVGE